MGVSALNHQNSIGLSGIRVSALNNVSQEPSKEEMMLDIEELLKNNIFQDMSQLDIGNRALEPSQKAIIIKASSNLRDSSKSPQILMRPMVESSDDNLREVTEYISSTESPREPNKQENLIKDKK